MPAKDPNSKPPKSKKSQPPQNPVGMAPLDKVYWGRCAMATLAGLVSGETFGMLSQPSGGLTVLIVFYLFSVLLSRALVADTVGIERQLYTQGIGTYLLLWFMIFSLYATFVLYHA